VARCQDDASLAQLVDELGATVHAIRRLIDKASIHRFPHQPAAPVSAAAAPTSTSPFGPPGLGFASLQAYLVWLPA
jgi:hypothetical protein